MRIYYNQQLKKLAAKLRNESTRSEIRLWQRLKGKQLGVRFIRQKPIGNYIIDFYSKELQLAVELDGLSHHREDVMEKDAAKSLYLQKLGIHILRFEDKEVFENINNVIAVILDFIEQHKKDINCIVE